MYESYIHSDRIIHIALTQQAKLVRMTDVKKTISYGKLRLTMLKGNNTVAAINFKLDNVYSVYPNK